MPNLDLIYGPGPPERETRSFVGGQPLGAQIDVVVAELQGIGALVALPGAQLLLFRKRNSSYEPLRRDQSPAELGLRNGEELYLADELAPWMCQPASTVAPSSSPAGGPSCRITIAEGCVVAVTDPLVSLGRAWLLQHLRAAGRDDRDHRLRFVSRACHCELLRHGVGWAVRPEKDTLLEGELLTTAVLVPLPVGRTRLVLGEHGWPLTLVTQV